MENISKMSDDMEMRYILELGLPLYPEHMKHPTSSLKQSKLLFEQKNYVIHFKNSKQALNLGLKLTKIHRIMIFTRSRCLKVYIDLNTRKQSKNEFEIFIYNLMYNAVKL